MLEINDAWLVLEWTEPQPRRFENPLGGRWVVALRGDPADLVRWPGIFVGPTVTVVERQGSYYLRTPELDAEEDIEKARDIAIRRVELMNGVMAVMFSDASPIDVGSLVTELDELRKKGTFHSETPVYYREPQIPTELPNDTANHLISLAVEDPVVAHALRLRGYGRPDAVTLYKIYELISKDTGGGDAIADKGWATKTELRRFTNSMNNPNVLGDQARHAASSATPPAQPMSIPDARVFVEKLLKAWLIEKRRSAK